MFLYGPVWMPLITYSNLSQHLLAMVVLPERKRGERGRIAYPRFQVNQNRARDVPCIVALVVEDVFAVAALGRKFLEVTVLVDSMLLAELLPELASDCPNASDLLTRLNITQAGSAKNSLLLPHCPAWMVIISLRAHG